jgi:Nif-specific regulatory protein
MAVSSQETGFDNRLLAIEELFRQRKYDTAGKELKQLTPEEFQGDDCQLGLYLSLAGDAAFNDGEYRQALELGWKAAKIIAGLPLNQRYGRILLTLSKTYSALGDIKNGEIRAYDALASYRRADDSLGQVDALNELARVASIRSDYRAACKFLEEATTLAVGNPRKLAQLTGNVARMRILLGEWAKAETELKRALDYHEKHDEEQSQAINLLSLGYLHLRRCEYVFADRYLTRGRELIDKLGLKREKIIYLEYAGELASEKGDFYKAKLLLTEAYHQGRLLAPASSLVSQSGRRLAEAELALDNIDDAMKYAQKALDLAVQIGEQSEKAIARRVIAQVFAARAEFGEALEHCHCSVEIAREIGDPFDLARTLLVTADILRQTDSDEVDKIRNLYEEAGRIFRKLNLDYWVAETEYQAGVFACQQGRLSRGFKKLSRAERTFLSLAESSKARRVSQYLSSLAGQAVALSISEDNEYRLFGSLINQAEIRDLKTGRMSDILKVLIQRTGAVRAIIVSDDPAGDAVISSCEMTPLQIKKFVTHFRELLGEEICTNKPTLLLDTRRDPYINDLFPDIPDAVASVMVVPFRLSDGSTSFIYLDRLSVDSALNPFSQDALNFAVGFSEIIAFRSAELQRAKLLEDNRRLKAQLMQEAAFPNIITQNKRMLEILAQVRQVVDSNISIAIEGDTGCGKDLLARAIHYNSLRRDKRFISVNCAALPETLLESELFGYHRGAFTGADRDKPGLFEEADGGTFFLDEIADMPLSIQAKLLRVLEEKEIVRLGESVPRKVDVRILSATNRDIRKETERGMFREDLYYRLTALTFRLPPLRERREDIPLLVNHFLGENGKKVSSEAMRYLVAYDWPGNVRELDNEIRKLILLSAEDEQIRPDLLSAKIRSTKITDLSPNLWTLPSSEEVVFSDQYSLYDYLAAHERRFIIKALRDRKGVKKHAAALLNIPESTLRLKIKEYDIDLNRLDAVN